MSYQKVSFSMLNREEKLHEEMATMTNQIEPKPHTCYDFTVGGIVNTPVQAGRALREANARWLAEQEQASVEKASTDPQQDQ